MDVTDALLVIPGVIAALAAVMTAFVACKMEKLERLRDKNRILFLKHESEVEHLQKLIASFARVAALDSAQWNNKRNQEIDEAILDMKFHLSILEALNTKISADIGHWAKAENPKGETISQIIDYQIGYLHSTGHEGRTNFFKYKMEELKKIQDKMYSEMTKE